MNLYRYRSRYWSLSKLGDYILSLGNITRPDAETHQGWIKWKREAKSKSPILFYIVEELMSDLQNICMFPYDIYSNIRVYIINRYIEKSHYLNTKLKAGEYHEINDRMLHGMFETLVDFIEVEKAHMYQMWTLDLKKTCRSREYGLKNIEWEKQLTFDDNIHYTPQALAAQEQESLYLWWKDIRPNRPDPWDISGYNEFYEQQKANRPEDADWLGLELDEDTSNTQRELFRIVRDIEQQYEDEDTQMLIRLVKIRKELWT